MGRQFVMRSAGVFGSYVNILTVRLYIIWEYVTFIQSDYEVSAITVQFFNTLMNFVSGKVAEHPIQLKGQLG